MVRLAGLSSWTLDSSVPIVPWIALILVGCGYSIDADRYALDDSPSRTESDPGAVVGGDAAWPDVGGPKDGSLEGATDALEGPDASDAAEQPADAQGLCENGPLPPVLGAPCCRSSQTACAGHAQRLVLICDPTTFTWTSLQSCADNQRCDTSAGPQQGTCQNAVPGCVDKQPGTLFCQDQLLVECGPDLVTTEETACEFACNNGQCGGACTPGDRRCEGSVPWACTSNGAWESEAPCTFVCSGKGTCGGACVPGSRQCSGQLPQQCDSAGQWQYEPACQNQTCVSGSCQGVCEPGTKQCSGVVPQVCDGEGQWQHDNACAGSCFNGACCPSTLSGGQQLNRNEYICSPNGGYRFGMNAGGDLVLVSNQTTLWSAGLCCDAEYVFMQKDGNLVVRNSSVESLWHSSTQNHPGAYLSIEDAGRAVIRLGAAELWSTGP